MQNDLDPKGFEAALGCYSEGGCSGLDERERREVVTDIIEAYLSAVPDGEGELVRDLLSIEAIMEVIAKGERTLNPDFAVHVQTTITKARKALAASRLSQAGVMVTDEMVERFAAELWKLDDAYARSIPHSKIRSALEAALPGDTL